MKKAVMTIDKKNLQEIGCPKFIEKGDNRKNQ
jgi:hypothetical protein